MAEGVASTELAKSDNTFYGLMRRLLRSKAAIFGLVIIGLMFICALFAPLIATHDYAKQDLPSMLQPPSKAHLFGTDEFGRDIFSRVIYGSRVSIKVGFLAVGISLLTGLFFGSIAGYYGRLLDSVICALIDIALAFPMTLLAIAIIAVLGPGLFNVCLAIALSSWGHLPALPSQFLSQTKSS